MAHGLEDNAESIICQPYIVFPSMTNIIAVQNDVLHIVQVCVNVYTVGDLPFSLPDDET